jgi:uncharacterized protein (DUF2147 family)
MTSLLYIFSSLLMVLTSLSDKPSEQITGIWLTAEKDGKIKVYKKGNKYYGKIIWINESVGPDGKTKLDVNNPDPNKRSRPIVGMNIVEGLEWDAEAQEWNEGEIYDPQSGSTYSVYAEMINENRLFIKGYIGFSLLGRSTEWTRIR